MVLKKKISKKENQIRIQVPKEIVEIMQQDCWSEACQEDPTGRICLCFFYGAHEANSFPTKLGMWIPCETQWITYIYLNT